MKKDELDRRLGRFDAVADALRAAWEGLGDDDPVPDPAELADRWAGRTGGVVPRRVVDLMAREAVGAVHAGRKPPVVAFLGPEGTFTHMAAHDRFGSCARYVALPSIEDVFTEVERGAADRGVVPIENSSEGGVMRALDLFADSPVGITGEVILPIAQHLIGRCALDDVRRVSSKLEALAQCRQWLRSHLPDVELVETTSTARAVEIARDEDGTAAIAARFAAELYGVPVITESIQDSTTNRTRFLVLGGEPAPPTGHDRTSLMFVVRDRAGALYDGLQPFRTHRINMTRIESRPSRRRPWEYVFFVDLAGHIRDEEVAAALAELREHCERVKVLGAYRRADSPEEDTTWR